MTMASRSLALMACMSLDLVRAYKTNTLKGPTLFEKEDVVSVWNTMSKWGAPLNGACSVGMYMYDNSMSMQNTQFSFTGSLGHQAGLLQEAAEVRAPPQTPEIQQVAKFGPVQLGKYMAKNTLTMLKNTLSVNGKITETAKLEQSSKTSLARQSTEPAVPAEAAKLVELDKDGVHDGAGRSEFTRNVSEHSFAQVHATPSHMYMWANKLSMDVTHFTMNIGAAAGSSLLQEESASVMSFDDLDINMFMYENSMSMTGTDFTMNVNTLPFSETITPTSAGTAGADLSRLLLLTTSVFGEASTGQDITFSSAMDTQEVRSVWDWMKSWSSSSMIEGTSANINMHMYNNSMSMDKTVFAMNVGESASVGFALEEAGITKLAEGSNAQTAKAEESAFAGSDAKTSKAKAGVSAVADWKMYKSGMDLKDTKFSIKVGSLLQQSGTAQLPPMGPGSDINMHMYQNQMSMKDTIFTMNIGKQASLLETTSALQSHVKSVKQGGTMNIKRLNIKMYMYKNDMKMVDTVFKWRVG
eukprot:TRINITY_DN12619_c0_g1_i1.p1 TRINITY_DN12619_c0_g1~~TRINITY_DN12619_c0_g1_i1.p1  ORF type:complete len:526 (+),score=117.80 TRINITY_DN12619_c0_g1_i1:95-1672(+)